MPRSLGCHHRHINISWRFDVAESDVEAVPEKQRLTGGQVWLDVSGIQRALDVVGSQNHDDVRFRGGLGRCYHSQAVCLRLCTTTRPLAKTHSHVDTGVAQVLRVRVALTAISDDSNF